MLVCQQCQHEQEAGERCEQCGGELVAKTVSESEKGQAEQGAETEQTLEKVESPDGEQTPEQTEVPQAESAQQSEPTQQADSIKQAEAGEPVEPAQQAQQAEQAEPAQQAQQADAAAASVETGEKAEQIKNAFQEYFGYTFDLIKNPTEAFQLKENKFVYGLITMGVYALAYALSLYFLFISMYRGVSRLFKPSFSFFDFAVPLFFFVLVFLVGGLVGTFVAIKLLKAEGSVKKIIATYGGLIVPFTALNIVMILFGIIGLTGITFALTSLSLVFSLYIIPVLFAFKKGAKVQAEHHVYLSLAAGAISMFISFVVIRFAISEALPMFGQMFSLF